MSYPRLKAGASCLITAPPCLPLHTNPEEGRGGVGRNSASRRRHAGEHKVIAVDVGVVECGGRPIRVWVMVDPYNYEAVNLCGSGYPHQLGQRRIPSGSCGDREKDACMDDPVILTEGVRETAALWFRQGSTTTPTGISDFEAPLSD